MGTSPLTQIKSLETQLRAVVSKYDIADLNKDERAVVTTLKHDLIDARLDIRDYELSETRAEQIAQGIESVKRLEQIRGHILAGSEYNMFSGVDVAQFSAQLEQIIEELK
ncbi:MAG: hypothetical protein ACREGB_01515 [Candidatus Saccharimonadales bacterium]